MDDDKKITAATNHIVNEFTTVMTKLGPELRSRFGIDGQELNIAIARAGMGITAMAAMSNYERPIEDVQDLADKIEELVERTIKEG